MRLKARERPDVNNSAQEKVLTTYCIGGKFEGELNLVVGVETAKLKLCSFACNV